MSRQSICYFGVNNSMSLTKFLLFFQEERRESCDDDVEFSAWLMFMD